MVHIMMMVFHRFPPINLNLWEVYNHMDAVIKCSDWDPDPPNTVESDKVMFFCSKEHNYIIAISEQVAVTHEDRVCFLGEVHWRLGQEGWPSRSFIFITNTWWVQVFCRDWCWNGQKCDKESVGQAGGQALLHVQLYRVWCIVTALIIYI